MNPAPLLLVEDDPDDVLLFTAAMAQAGGGVPVRLARDGEDALAYLDGVGVFADRAAHLTPALVVLDLKLPRRSGLEVLARIRTNAASRDLPVVVLTSSNETRDVAAARALGVSDYFVKPSNLTELVAVARTIRARWMALVRRDVDA